MVQGRYVFPFSQLRMTDVDRVGGKNASLGELLSQLTSAGIRVPDGFATTAEALSQRNGKAAGTDSNSSRPRRSCPACATRVQNSSGSRASSSRACASGVDHTIDIRFPGHVQKLPRIGRQAFHIAPLPFGIDRIEGQR